MYFEDMSWKKIFKVNAIKIFKIWTKLSWFFEIVFWVSRLASMYKYKRNYKLVNNINRNLTTQFIIQNAYYVKYKRGIFLFNFLLKLLQRKVLCTWYVRLLKTMGRVCLTRSFCLFCHYASIQFLERQDIKRLILNKTFTLPKRKIILTIGI